MSEVRSIDVRGLPPPEPMLDVLAALRELPEGGTLSVRIHRRPYPLYEILERHGWAHATEALPDGSFVVTIRRKP